MANTAKKAYIPPVNKDSEASLGPVAPVQSAKGKNSLSYERG